MRPELEFDITMRGLAQGLRVSSIMSYPLQVVSPQEDAWSLFREPMAEQFDCAPVREGDQILGVVYREDLEAGIAAGCPAVEAMRPLHRIPMVSDSTPIESLISQMHESGEAYWLVLRGVRIDAIVTLSDLWKLPVRLLAFSKLVHLEQLMSRHIRQHWPDGTWQSTLTDKRLQRLRETEAAARNRNEDLDPLDLSYLPDKLRILESHPRHASLARSLGGVVELRNQVAHVRDTDPHLDSARKLIERMALLTAAIEQLSEGLSVESR